VGLLAALALVLTWLLMVVGATTRAEGAGLSCPDWPLCHGHVVPPVDRAMYPEAPRYAVHRVYLEFSHRVLAACVAATTLVLAWRLRQRRRTRRAALLLGLLAAQVMMGAVTVLAGNAPWTVIIHLALALSYLSAVAATLVQELPLSPHAPVGSVRDVLLLALVDVQLLIGVVVSAHGYGLACLDFPLCEPGLPLAGAVAWQVAHRVAGFSILAAAVMAVVFRPLHFRRHGALLLALVLIQVALGAVNVLWRLPPLASGAHLGVAVLIHLALLRPLLGWGAPRDVVHTRGLPVHTRVSA